MFIITGDTHGLIDLSKIIEYFDHNDHTYTKNDYLIICGDVGVCGFSKENEKEVRRILNSFPTTTLFIDGNHEHFDHLNAYPIKTWNGGNVHFIEDTIIHLMRGQVFSINGLKFFTFGGAKSVDQKYRIEGLDWFKDEMPNEKEYKEGLENLKKHNFNIDYVLSHDGPINITNTMGFLPYSKEELEIRKYLQKISEEITFKDWYFGHFHKDIIIDQKYHCLYNNIIIL